MKPDRIFYIKPEQVHFMHIEESLKYSALQFTEDFIIPINWDMGREIPVYKDIDKNEKNELKSYSIKFKRNQSAICPIPRP